MGYYDNILGTSKMSLYIEMGFPNSFIIEDEQKYLHKVLKDLKKIGVVKDEELIDYHSVVMDPAYVHINQKGIQSVAKYKKQLAQNNIYSIGRYGSWTYCSIEDNIIEAKDLAKNLLINQ
jgi:putative amine oxidase (flavin-containing)